MEYTTKTILVIGSGISGMTAAVRLAQSAAPNAQGALNAPNVLTTQGAPSTKVILASPYVSERSQSVMAAGGINASIDTVNDSYESHAQDTLVHGLNIENPEDVTQFCKRAPEMISFLESLGTVFQRNDDGSLYLRTLGGHANKRTVCAGALVGKQIVTALTTKCREFEAKGILQRKLRTQFHSLLINDGICYGALLFNEEEQKLEAIYADSVIMATGGQNLLFGKTTGSLICDGYATGRLFEQGVKLRNLEFIQYHPTAIETPHKKMLISEAARGEGGRLFYYDTKDGRPDGTTDKRVYFMEDKFGPKGNLKPRDVVSREMFLTGRQIYLDISFLDNKTIHDKLEDIYDLCKTYLDLDVTKQPIPVSPAIHFFMGGIYVDSHHRTNIANLYAVGECASKYHGANRLGGNSLLSAVYSGTVAAETILSSPISKPQTEFSTFINQQNAQITGLLSSASKFPSFYLRQMLSDTMNTCLGIVRTKDKLEDGLAELENLSTFLKKLKYDKDVSIYENYRLPQMLLLARAIVSSALFRQESRGAHFRSDFPNLDDSFAKPTIASYCDGQITIQLES